MPYFTVIAALLIALSTSSMTAPLRAASPGSPLATASDDRSYDAWGDEDDDDDDDRDAYDDRDFDDDSDDSAHGPDDDGDWEIEDGPRAIRA